MRLAAVWESEVVPLLKSAPGVRPVAIFDEIRRRHPEISVGVRRMIGSQKSGGGEVRRCFLVRPPEERQIG